MNFGKTSSSPLLPQYNDARILIKIVKLSILFKIIDLRSGLSYIGQI